jgi:hypothetical protein
MEEYHRTLELEVLTDLVGPFHLSRAELCMRLLKFPTLTLTTALDDVHDAHLRAALPSWRPSSPKCSTVTWRWSVRAPRSRGESCKRPHGVCQKGVLTEWS